jgi:hypothetical protein
MSEPQKKMELTPMQLATMLVLDNCCVTLQTGANQLGGFLGLKREADILHERLKDLVREKEKLIESWGRKIQLVPASAMPPAPPVINGKR